jgi:hyperosmotically inducible periplasmic protein
MARRTFIAVVALVVCISCGGMTAPKVTPASDDQSLIVRVRTALLNEPAVHANEITVDVQGGVVVLSGHVHGQREIDAAVGAARRVSGVKDVRSELQGDRS